MQEIPKKTKGLDRVKNACLYSFAGFKSTIKTEVAFRQELITFVILLIPLFLLPFSIAIKMILIFSHILVLIVELLNSAIEAVVDLSSPNYHKLAKISKDIGSAAVMISIILVIILWVIALFNLFSV